MLILRGDTDLQVCDDFDFHSSCQSVWNGTATKSVESNSLSSSIIPAYSPNYSPIPSTSLPHTSSTTATSSIPTVTPTSVTIPHSSSFPSEVTPTRSGAPLPAQSPVSVVDESSEGFEDENTYVVAFWRRTQVRSLVSTISSTVTGEPQGSLGKIHTINADGQTAVQVDGLGYTNSTVVLDRECLISLNWPAAT